MTELAALVKRAGARFGRAVDAVELGGVLPEALHKVAVAKMRELRAQLDTCVVGPRALVPKEARESAVEVEVEGGALVTFYKSGLGLREVRKLQKAAKVQTESEEESDKRKTKSRPVPEDELSRRKRARAEGGLPDIEIEHVKDVYDAIAPHWHGTRYKAWPQVEAFVRGLAPGSLVGDFGCGNGKNLPSCNENGIGLGCDFSAGLVKICADLGHEVSVADATRLPYRDNVFDAALSIAVLHHISTDARRVQLIAETMRTLRVGGRALFYAWAQEQDEGVSGHRFSEADVFVPWHLRGQDCVFDRYCHVYQRGELEALFQQIPGVCIERSYYDCGNWCVIARKEGTSPRS
ncbi:Alkylated DNA repair protein alkB-like 8 [Hondaea fermentalgiana]|uniref:Alkylated DNA repair protein alkB-like 8 n=1 Tax=Hondaea fermentalgiana TaxID=2315210 RepID=A0A2R5GSD9_9STRA|nr:Alkylated DNA repair protein alkB-like 8 [Hondaea fermentalgiana]|eukprot:GBG30794.1 Alkylated DNA repair protein alkB-like 8 [Hondaea fermentalgiana]